MSETMTQDIIASPKILYWSKMPKTISENDIIDLLSKDILLINWSSNIKDIEKLKDKNSDYSAFLYNLDNLLEDNNIQSEEILVFIQKIVSFLYQNKLTNSLVYSTLIDNRINEIFKRMGILYLTKNLNDKKLAITTILKMIQLLFQHKNIPIRSYLRINIAKLTYPVEMMYDFNANDQKTNGYIKDIGMNGVGIVINDNDVINRFILKQFVRLEMNLKYKTIIIDKAIITRIDRDKKELGISYDLSNKMMIRSDYAAHLNRIIFHWLKEVIAEYSQQE